jgi:hypothetical protein
VKQYLFLAEKCGEIEVVLDLVSFSLSTKSLTATVLFIINKSIAAFSRVFLKSKDLEKDPQKLYKILEITIEIHRFAKNKVQATMLSELETFIHSIFLKVNKLLDFSVKRDQEFFLLDICKLTVKEVIKVCYAEWPAQKFSKTELGKRTRGFLNGGDSGGLGENAKVIKISEELNLISS